MKIYITGVSGTGKSTISKELKKRGIVSFDIDSISGLCHWRNKETGKRAQYKPGIGKVWINAHGWVCDLERLKNFLKKHKENIVVVGITANQSDYLSLFDKVFLLHCSEKTLADRLKNRKSNEFGKDIVERKQVLNWYKDFQEKTIKQGAMPIDTEGDILDVVDKIISKIY
jgi:broad-specificity NMP kinase